MENEEFYSLDNVSSILGIGISAIYWRCKNLNIKRFKIENERGSFLNEKQLKLIVNYQYKPCKLKKSVYSPKKIKIVECFLKNKSNSVDKISKELNIEKHKVHSVINEYLENKTITVMSKL